MKTDRTTGLPKLPDGYYFLINESAKGNLLEGSLVVIVCASDGTRVCHTNVFTFTKDAIKRAAKALAKNVYESERDEIFKRKVIGKYPPERFLG